MKTLLLIDANSLIHRCFHALPPLNAPDGRPTQSLYGISNILLKIFKDEKPEYAAALFDRPERTFRKEKFEAYKAQRPKAPDDLVSQIIESRNLFRKFGVQTFEKAGYEADDLIATLAEKFKKERDLRVMILTGDLDTLQMVWDDRVVVRTFRKGISDTFIYNESAVFDRYGLKPGQLVDYKALVGDQSDNIPGVAGVGEKTATELLKKYGTIDEVYKNLDKEPKLKKKLEGTKKEAEFSKSLVILDRQVPVEVKGLRELMAGENREELKEYFESLGFESLVKRVASGGNSQKREKAPAASVPPRRSKAGQASIFGSNIKQGDFGSYKDKVFVLENELDNPEYSSNKLKIGFELKRFLKEFWVRKKDLSPPYFDLGVAFWMLDPDFKDHSPEAIFKKFLKANWKGQAEDYEKVFEFGLKKMREYEVLPVFQNIEMPLLPILAEMEKTGILINLEKLKILEGKISQEIKTLEKEIYKAAGEEFNINSSQQLGKIIFEKLGVSAKRAKKTSGGAISTREESLLEFRSDHKIVDLVLEYRENFKILTTYAKPLQDLAEVDGRVHTEFVQTGAATGRLSSRNPNLQNIPQESKWSRELRSVFEAQRGFSLISFDYSQIELRVFAALAGDKVMKEAFLKGIDIHALTASKILGISIDKVGNDERRLAKTLNFGLLYGMGVVAFQRASGLNRAKAKEFIDTYFKEFKEIREWQERTKEEVRIYGYTKTLTGRRRYLGGIKSLAPQVVAEAERAAINHPLQGLSADIMKMAMIKSKEKLQAKKIGTDQARMLLTIHDELLFEVRDDMIEDTRKIIQEEMEQVFDLGVPLKVEVSAGKDLGHLNKLKN